MDIKGSVAVITGGASGLGEATVRRLVAKGARVAILDINESGGNALVKELGEDKAVFFKTNVAVTGEVQAAIDGIMDKWGHIDICCPIAGIGSGAKTATKKGPHKLDAFKRVIDVNLIGNFDTIRQCAFHMLKNEANQDGERGVIINCSSDAAYEGQVGQVAYTASKAAVAGMTLVIARDLSEDGIRCCTIVPGLFDTPILKGVPEHVKEAICQSIPFPSRMGKPDEFAFLVEHIVENPYLNGETIRLDGAVRMQMK
ncbi:MAG TPA: SDR family NAD(P)-dependent oxidoreductase [Tepidanaerobacteraceae bacterium]|nr:SDR family NAD(P)-dependent oxidoreductase [Tepidanaerobacteraceae bacterium]